MGTEFPVRESQLSLFSCGGRAPEMSPQAPRPPAFTPPPPRLTRMRDAPAYLGMDKNRFNREVRPRVLTLRIGVQGIAFDRVDLDAWADDYKSRNGCHAARSHRSKLWEPRKCQVSPSAVEPGTSTRCSEERAFAKAAAQARSSKPRSC